MVEIVSHVDVKLPPHLTRVDENCFWEYLIWEEGKKELSKRILERFKQGVVSQSQEHVPVGDEIEFEVTTKRYEGRPQYARISEGFGTYLDILLGEYEKGIRRNGVRTFEGEPYIRAQMVIDKLKEDVKTKRGEEITEHKVDLIRPGELRIWVPEHIAVVWSRDYSALTDYNARVYQGALSMINEGDKRAVGFKDEDGKEVKRFKKLLLEDSLQTLSGVPSNPVALLYPFENMIFIHQLEPRRPIRHSDVVNAFIQPLPERLTKRSKAGDLIIANEVERIEALREKGLVSDEFVVDYNPTVREGHVYVRLRGVQKRLVDYKQKFVNPTIEQNISMIPPRYWQT